MTSCIQCEFHKIVNDKSPDDWFNDDDEAVLCSKSSNVNFEKSAVGDLFRYRPITVSCRPYQTEKETTPIPSWCPMGFNKKSEDGKDN